MTFEWTPDHIKTLIALWNEGHTTSEIGSRMGITKNAVVGKVHRLGLPKRGSPIKPKPEKKSNVVSMAQLRPGMCVWPTGDPATDDFHFMRRQANFLLTFPERGSKQVSSCEGRREGDRHGVHVDGCDLVSIAAGQELNDGPDCSPRRREQRRVHDDSSDAR